jgi:hypothetical protein
MEISSEQISKYNSKVCDITDMHAQLTAKLFRLPRVKN